MIIDDYIQIFDINRVFLGFPNFKDTNISINIGCLIIKINYFITS